MSAARTVGYFSHSRQCFSQEFILYRCKFSIRPYFEFSYNICSGISIMYLEIFRKFKEVSAMLLVLI